MKKQQYLIHSKIHWSEHDVKEAIVSEQDAKEAIRSICLADDRFAEQFPGTNILNFIPNLNKAYVAFTFSKQIEADLYSPR